MKKPTHFLILKIVGFLGVAIAITGLIFTITGFGSFENNNFLIGMILSPLGIMAGAVGLSGGFAPELAKAKTKSARYIQEQNKEDLSTIASNSAKITSQAVTITAQAVKEGVKDTVFCKHCGAKIDSDSTYCASCGKKQ